MGVDRGPWGEGSRGSKGWMGGKGPLSHGIWFLPAGFRGCHVAGADGVWSCQAAWHVGDMRHDACRGCSLKTTGGILWQAEGLNLNPKPNFCNMLYCATANPKSLAFRGIIPSTNLDPPPPGTVLFEEHGLRRATGCQTPPRKAHGALESVPCSCSSSLVESEVSN